MTTSSHTNNLEAWFLALAQQAALIEFMALAACMGLGLVVKLAAAGDGATDHRFHGGHASAGGARRDSSGPEGFASGLQERAAGPRP